MLFFLSYVGLLRDRLGVMRQNAHIKQFIDLKLSYQQSSLLWAVPGLVDQASSVLADQATYNNLCILADFFRKQPENFKLVLQQNSARVYTNNILLLSKLNDNPILSKKQFTYAKITRPINTIALINPKYKFRSYLINMHLTDEKKEQLSSFLEANKDELQLSESMERWIQGVSWGVRSHFFIDHNNDQHTLMLNLIFPRLINKTLAIFPTK